MQKFEPIARLKIRRPNMVNEDLGTQSTTENG